MLQSLLLWGVVWAPLLLANPVDPSTPPPAGKPLETTLESSERGEEENWEVGSSMRAQLIYPSNWGMAGIFRVRSAESLPPGTLTFGIGGEFYAMSNVGFLPGTSANTIAENIFLGFSPAPHLTLAAQRRNSSTTFGTPRQLISSLGDFNFSGMYMVPLGPAFAIAPIANVLIASNFNNLAPAGETLSVGAGLAATFNGFGTFGIPLFLHANALYHMPQIRTSKATATVEPEAFFNFSRYHTIRLALGAEWHLGDFIPFMELDQAIQAGSPVRVMDSPSRLSFGTRITPIENKSLALLLGADVGLGRGIAAGVPFSPSYQILGQISYTVALTSTERKHYRTSQDVRIVDRRFVLSKNVNFKVGSAELDSSSSELLDQIAGVIQQNDVQKLLIVGHTDSTHSENYNLKLSLDRANSVKRYLVAKGIAEETLMTQGYGKRRPKASNSTEQGRLLNRRVEFLIVE